MMIKLIKPSIGVANASVVNARHKSANLAHLIQAGGGSFSFPRASTPRTVLHTPRAVFSAASVAPSIRAGCRKATP